MICPGCQQERSSLRPSPFGVRCRECGIEQVVPSLRTDVRMGGALFSGFFSLLIFPPLFILWVPFAAFAIARWAPANRKPALGGLALFAIFWAALVPQMVDFTKTSPYIEGSVGSAFVALLVGVFLSLYFWRPTKAVVFELLFRGRGMAAGLLQSGALVAVAGTFLLAFLLLL